MQQIPLLFDIKRYAINDGPGIRITIFFKGCPLSCNWCHNPEGIDSNKQKLYNLDKCIKCQECIKVCNQNALSLIEDVIITDTYKCNLCGDCASVCPTKAIEISGELNSVSEIMHQIEKEIFMFDESDGGVTFSGGEPLLHHEFLLELLKECKSKNIHTCVDTSGYASKNVILEIAKYTDLFLYDLKIIDEEKHKKHTGVSNEIIIKNLLLLAEIHANIQIRIPLIGGFNSDDLNIHETAKFISSLSDSKIITNILPYHNIAAKKYQKLNIDYQSEGLYEISDNEMLHIISIFKGYSISPIIGG